MTNVNMIQYIGGGIVERENKKNNLKKNLTQTFLLYYKDIINNRNIYIKILTLVIWIAL